MSEDGISSPCKRNDKTETNTCQIEHGRCTTCGRTREDIATWAAKTEEERKSRIEELRKKSTQ